MSDDVSSGSGADDSAGGSPNDTNLRERLKHETFRRVQAEAFTRQQEASFQTLFEAALDGIVLLNERGVVENANSAATQILRCQASELMDQEFAAVALPPSSRLRFRRNLSRYTQQDDSSASLIARRVDEFEARRCSGEPFPAELTILPIGEGESPKFAVFLRDVTERIETQNALREAKEEAEAANRAKSAFLAAMSHDIRTPMNAILGMTELVLDSPIHDTQREYLRMVNESGEALLELINDILDFSKVEAGKMQLDRVEFDLWELLGDTMKAVAMRACDKDVAVTCHIHPRVPQRLIGDPTRLRQIITNLAGNAVKFTKEGEVVLEVDHAEQSQMANNEASQEPASRQSDTGGPSAMLWFAVRDSGVGIPADRVGAVFEAFEQVDAGTTRQFGGTGLGLAIAKRLVSMMDGCIWVESKLGEGSTFQFTARFELPTSSEEDRTDSGPLPNSARQRNLLVLDCSPSGRRMLAELLEAWKLQYDMPQDAVAAERVLDSAMTAENPPDLVLIDPQMCAEGSSLASRLAQLPPSTHIVLLQKAGTRAPRNLPFVDRANASMMKPLKATELLQAIARTCGSEGPQSDLAQSDSAQSTSESTQLGPLEILVAEDSIVNQKLALGVLRPHGHHVVVVNNGEAAVNAVQEQRFDVVLMDVEMPVLDGIEATREIRQREQASGNHVPIIAMTAHAMKGDRERLLACGMDEYIAKPVRRQQLYEKLALVLETLK